MSKSGEFYNCIPKLNKECKKVNCYLSGGPCYQTITKEYSLDYLLKDYELTKNEWNDLFEENVKMHQEIKEARTYKKRISKAIALIQKKLIEVDIKGEARLNLVDLVEILEGKDKNDK